MEEMDGKEMLVKLEEELEKALQPKKKVKEKTAKTGPKNNLPEEAQQAKK